MGLTPLDIRRHRFHLAFRGYNRIEVDGLMEAVADELDGLALEKARLAEEVGRMGGEIQSLKDREEDFRRALLAAQQVIDQMQENARKTAELTVAQADAKAEKILAQAHQRLAELQTQIGDLKRKRKEAELQIRSVLQSHARLLDMDAEQASAREESEDKLKVLKRP